MATLKQYKRAATSFQGLAHPIRLQILEALQHGSALSPIQFVEIIQPPSSLGSISYHTRTLRSAGLIAKARTRTVRGAVQHFYRLSPRGKELLKLADQLL